MPLHRSYPAEDPQGSLRGALADWQVDGHAQCWWAHTTAHRIHHVVAIGDGRMWIDSTPELPDLAWLWLPPVLFTVLFGIGGVNLFGLWGAPLALVGAVMGTWTGLLLVRQRMPDAEAAQSQLAERLSTALDLQGEWSSSDTPMSTTFPIVSDAVRLDYVTEQLGTASEITVGPIRSAADQIAHECALHPDSDRMKRLALHG